MTLRSESTASDPDVIDLPRLWWQDRLPVHEARNEADNESTARQAYPPVLRVSVTESPGWDVKG